MTRASVQPPQESSIRGTAKDPVCGMEVNKSKAVILEQDGQVYYFCSEDCRRRFLAQERTSAERQGPAAQVIHTADEHQEHIAAQAIHSHHGVEHAAHRMEGGHEMQGGHHAHMVADFRRRFWISLAITVPIVILSPTVGLVGQFPSRGWILFFLATAIYFYGGRPFLTGAAQELRDRLPGMMTLVAVAISVAYLYSDLVQAGIPGQPFFWELATLIDIMLLGHWIEMRSVLGASKALEELARLMPNEAHLIQADGSLADVRLDELAAGQRVLVRPGERLPADGQIVAGESEIDESMLTGESKPVPRRPPDRVIGGSVNGAGALTVQVTKTGAQSYLAQVVQLVEQAGASKSRAQGLADRAAFALTLIGLGGGFITLAIWLALGGGAAFAMERMVTVMVITCPHALGLAVPLVVAMITALSARNGLLVRRRTPFESAYRLNTIVFDKTGTLTQGQFGVSDVIRLGGWSEERLLQTAASVEQNSEHTIARGIVRKAQEAGLEPVATSDFLALPGRGAKAVVEGQEVLVGNTRILESTGLDPARVQPEVDRITAQGKTAVLVVSGGQVQGLIALADMIRAESKEAVHRLQELGLEVAMITGDNEPTARSVAENLGLNQYFAEVLPDEKSQKIRTLQGQGKKVAMVGDGVNDAPALAQADVGIAIGAGTDVAIETADVVLIENDPTDVADVIALSRLTHRKMVQNLLWATGYNVVAIPVAAGVLFPIGVVLPPAGGAVLMSLSTIIVAVNARMISYRKTRSPGAGPAR